MTIRAAHVGALSTRLGLDARGLGPDDRRILGLLIRCRRPLGIEAIAATLGLDADTVRAVHEPYLVAAGYIARDGAGGAMAS